MNWFIVSIIFSIFFFAIYMVTRKNTEVPPIKHRYYKDYNGKYVIEHYSKYRGWNCASLKADSEEEAKKVIDLWVSIDKFMAAPKEYKYYNGETE